MVVCGWFFLIAIYWVWGADWQDPSLRFSLKPMTPSAQVPRPWIPRKCRSGSLLHTGESPRDEEKWRTKAARADASGPFSGLLRKLPEGWEMGDFTIYSLDQFSPLWLWGFGSFLDMGKALVAGPSCWYCCQNSVEMVSEVPESSDFLIRRHLKWSSQSC